MAEEPVFSSFNFFFRNSILASIIFRELNCFYFDYSSKKFIATFFSFTKDDIFDMKHK